ncbi:MAG: proline-rich domain-containing protein [Pseudonocardiales bacterium]
MAGKDMGPLLTELHVHAVTGSSEERHAALAGLAEACMVAYCLAYRIGDAALAVTAACRGFDAAKLAERPDLAGMLAMSRTVALMRVRARRRAASVCAETLTELSALPGPTPEETRVGQARGILHLTSALVAARDGRSGEVVTHLGEARSLASHIGERNFLRYHFGPTNVADWELSIALETGDGPEAAQRFASQAVDLSVLGSRCREGYVRFALALWELRPLSLTDTGKARYAVLCAQRDPEHTVPPPECGYPPDPGRSPERAPPPAPGDRSGPT